MEHFIGKTGTGIERSGTGIERSGTGIEKSGTGSKFKQATTACIAAVALTFAFNVSATEPQVLVTRSADSVLVSVHAGPSILVGTVQLQDRSGNYAILNLYEAGGAGIAQSGLMVHGSGGGSPDTSCNPKGSGLMVHGSGGGSPGADCSPEGGKLMVHGSGGGSPESSCQSPGYGLLVHGSGGGSPDSACSPGDSGLMVHGSGGGSPGAACNPGGSGLMTQGSGGGASSDGKADCMTRIAPWGSAELVFDPAGTSIIVHRNGPNGPEEFMVEFIAGTPVSSNDFSAYSLPADRQTQPRQVAQH